MVFVRENFFYRNFFIEKMPKRNTLDIYIGCVPNLHFLTTNKPQNDILIQINEYT